MKPSKIKAALALLAQAIGCEWVKCSDCQGERCECLGFGKVLINVVGKKWEICKADGCDRGENYKEWNCQCPVCEGRGKVLVDEDHR